MIKSNKCNYKIGMNERKKKKYLTPEQAITAANQLNALPNTIKKFKPYKCTVCHFFHIGRSHEDIENKPEKNIFNGELSTHKPIEDTEEKIVPPLPTHDDF